MILLDTDHLTVVNNRQDARCATLTARLDSAGDSVAVPVICVEEQRKGWLAKIHRARPAHDQVYPYERLVRLFHFFRVWDICPFDTAAADQFERFRRQKIRIGSQDLNIAATALTLNALLLSANLRDFRKVPGLRVEDWLTA